MKVIVTQGSEILYNGKTYTAGDELDIDGELLNVFLSSGAIIEKKAKKK